MVQQKECEVKKMSELETLASKLLDKIGSEAISKANNILEKSAKDFIKLGFVAHVDGLRWNLRVVELEPAGTDAEGKSND